MCYTYSMGTNRFSEWLGKELRQRGWLQADLVRHSGISKAQVSRVLSGTSSPGREFCSAVARALNVPASLVFRKAGILPEEPPGDVDLERAVHLFRQLSPRQQQDVLTMMLALVEERDRD